MARTIENTKKTGTNAGIDVSGAIDLTEFTANLEKMDLGTARPFGKPMELVYGIFDETEGTTNRLTTIEVNPKVATGRFERELEVAEQKAKRNPEKHILKVSDLLRKGIVSIGGVPFKELAKKVVRDPLNYAQQWYLPDVLMALFAMRDTILQTRDYACVTQCACERQERIFDNPQDGRPLHSLDNLPFTQIQDLNGRPIFEIPLEDGFNDGEGEVSKIYIEPMRMGATARIVDQQNQQSSTIKLLKEMVVAMPESKVYGNTNKRFFNSYIYDEMTARDRRLLERAVNSLQAGPETQFKIECYLCMQGTYSPDDLNWLFLTRRFLYSSAEAPLN